MPLPPVQLDWLPIVAGTVISMIVGAVYFARPVMGNTWMRLVGLDPGKIKKEDAMRGILVALLLAVVLNAGFNLLLNWSGASTIAEGVIWGFWAWLAFALPTSMVHPQFEGRPALVGILYAGQHLIEYLLIGAAQVWLGTMM